MLPDPTFYDEFRRQGQLLVPERPVLLALVRLYSWLTAHGVEAVPEGKLREFLAQSEADVLAGEPASGYTPRLRYSGIIRDLQKYWLLRGVAPGPAAYSLRPHARALCERLHATLFSELVVSEIEAAFRRLREGIGESDEGFLAWARELLPQLSLNVEQQLVALDNAIETAVARLRQQTSHDEATFLVILQEVDATLVDLLQKATELSRAFGHTVELQTQRLHLWTSNDQEQTAVNQAARQALRFIDRARLRLDELSERLSWVHPRVQALFGNLSKRRFDRKTEQFLLALLRAEPETGPALLAGVALAHLAYQPLRFDRVPTAGQVLPAELVQVPKRVANNPAQQVFQARTEEQLRRRQGRYWLGELRRLLAPAGASVSFSEFGQRLAAAEAAADYEPVVITRDELSRRDIGTRHMGGSKQFESPALSRDTLRLLGLSELATADYISQTSIYQTGQLRANIIVLCESENYLKQAQKAKKLGMELQNAGGANAKKLETYFVPPPEVSLYYACDWDYDGLRIFRAIAAGYRRQNRIIRLLTPLDTAERKPVDSPDHYSQWAAHPWDDDLEPDAPVNLLFTAPQRALIRQMMTNNAWIAEESSEFTALIRANGVASS